MIKQGRSFVRSFICVRPQCHVDRKTHINCLQPVSWECIITARSRQWLVALKCVVHHSALAREREVRTTLAHTKQDWIRIWIPKKVAAPQQQQHKTGVIGAPFGFITALTLFLDLFYYTVYIYNFLLKAPFTRKTWTPACTHDIILTLLIWMINFNYRQHSLLTPRRNLSNVYLLILSLKNWQSVFIAVCGQWNENYLHENSTFILLKSATNSINLIHQQRSFANQAFKKYSQRSEKNVPGHASALRTQLIEYENRKLVRFANLFTICASIFWVSY